MFLVITFLVILAKTKNEQDSSSSAEEEGDDEETMSVVEGEDSLTESSSTDDENDDKAKCPICLNKFRNNNVAVPENCQHTFCFECISEWSTVSSYFIFERLFY